MQLEILSGLIRYEGGEYGSNANSSEMSCENGIHQCAPNVSSP